MERFGERFAEGVGVGAELVVDAQHSRPTSGSIMMAVPQSRFQIHGEEPHPVVTQADLFLRLLDRHGPGIVDEERDETLPRARQGGRRSWKEAEQSL